MFSQTFPLMISTFHLILSVALMITRCLETWELRLTASTNMQLLSTRIASVSPPTSSRPMPDFPPSTTRHPSATLQIQLTYHSLQLWRVMIIPFLRLNFIPRKPSMLTTRKTTSTTHGSPSSSTDIWRTSLSRWPGKIPTPMATTRLCSLQLSRTITASLQTDSLGKSTSSSDT